MSPTLMKNPLIIMTCLELKRSRSAPETGPKNKQKIKVIKIQFFLNKLKMTSSISVRQGYDLIFKSIVFVIASKQYVSFGCFELQ